MQLPFEPKVIFVNGPPRSGKDTVARLLNDMINLSSKRIADIRKFTSPMDDLLFKGWEACYLSDKYSFWEVRETYKDQPIMHAGAVPRQFLIDLSENFYKKYFGPTIFGRLAAKALRDDPRVTHIFSDSGFYQEVFGLVGAAEKITPNEMVVIQVHRDGCTFENDSRDWVDLQEIGIPLIKLNNSGTLEELEQTCYNMFHDLFLREMQPSELDCLNNATPDSAGVDTGVSSVDLAARTTGSGEDNSATDNCGAHSGKGDANKDVQPSKTQSEG